MEATFLQDSLTDNKEIFARIKDELAKSNNEILIAMAWFTDPELFTILEEKLNLGVKISIILSDHPDNDRLNFAQLQTKGAEIIKIKNVGYGIMHQKFCVIDNKLAIAGSYNWSVNARNNNHEQVIVTTYEKTIAELVENFHDIKLRAMRLVQGEPLDEIINSEKFIESLIEPQQLPLKVEKSIQEASIDEFKNVLDSIIAAEVGNFDKDLLRDNGYRRSQENSGDHQVLHQAMDSVYSSFINNIEVIEDKKRKLSTKIEEQQKLSIGSLQSKIAFEQNRLKEENRFSIENCKKHIVDIEGEKANHKLELDGNNNKKIPFIKAEIQDLKNKINEAERTFIKPRLNWPLLIACSIFGLLLAAYIFVFYSSVAYIFIFAKQDASELVTRGLNITIPEIFDPNVFEKMSLKGTGGYLFILFFVSIPYGLGLFHLFSPASKINETNNLSKWDIFVKFFNDNKSLLLIFIIDGFIAFKVSKNINHIEYLTNTTNEKLSFWEVFGSENFWLVFILGALGIYLFSVISKKFFSIFDERNPTIAEKKNQVTIKQLQEIIKTKEVEIHELEISNISIDGRISLSSNEIEKQKLMLDNLPLKNNDSLALLNQELEQGQERLINLSSIYRSHIENDKLPISVSALDDRVNVFMEGWSKFLHDKYSVMIAEKKTFEALEEILTWRTSKVALNNLAS